MTDKNFLGIPIEGDINKGDSRVKQEDPALLQAKIQELVDHPGFEAMRWTGYTPFFNDGDPCVFHIYEVYFRFVGMTPRTEDELDGYEEEDGFYTATAGGYIPEDNPGRAIFGVPNGWRLTDGWKVEPTDKGLIKLAYETSKMITSGAHYHFLLDSFGDHAKITLTPEKIEVEYYEHE